MTILREHFPQGGFRWFINGGRLRLQIIWLDKKCYKTLTEWGLDNEEVQGQTEHTRGSEASGPGQLNLFSDAEGGAYR